MLLFFKNKTDFPQGNPATTEGILNYPGITKIRMKEIAVKLI